VLAGFGVDLQGILMSAGVVSLGITLGAQNVLSQFFSGILILVNRPFRNGDFLKINDKVYIVRKVRLMYTEFKNWAGDEIITMPNNVVTSATISNMTKGDAVCRQYVYFSVAYGTDLNKAQRVMVEAARKCELVIEDRDHDIGTRITNFLASGVELRLSVYTPTFDDTSDAAGRLRGLVYEAFAENDIEIPYDRVQIDILSDRTENVTKS
jgi:small-conductance mechanosensitive channel